MNKKVFSLFLSLVLILGLTACASSDIGNDLVVEEDTSQTPGFKATKDGVLFTFPPEALDMNSIVVIRYEKDSNGNLVEDFSFHCHMLQQYGITSITDYFVDPGKEYYYSVTFWNSEKEIKIGPDPITPKHGTGELKLTSTPTGKYNDETGIMTFTPEIRFTPNIEKFIKSRDGAYEGCMVTYVSPDDTLHAHIKNNEANFLTEGSYQECYNVNLKFVKMSAYMDYKGISYITLVQNPNVPENVIVPDLRKELTLEPVDGAVKITIPKLPDFGNANIDAGFERFKKGDNSYSSRHLISIDSKAFKPDEETVLYDHLVEKNTEYEYLLRIFVNGEKVVSSKRASIKTGDTGIELPYLNQPVATYNPKTCVMEFETPPKLNEDLDKLIKNKHAKVKILARYYVENPMNNWDISFEIPENTKSIDLSKKSFYVDVNKKSLGLREFRIEINIDNIQHIIEILAEDLPGIPSPIVIKTK